MAGQNDALRLRAQADRDDPGPTGERRAAEDVAAEGRSDARQLAEIGVREDQSIPAGAIVLALVAGVVGERVAARNSVLERIDVVLRLAEIGNPALDQKGRRRG